MNGMVNVFLQNSCSYTREGIKSILGELDCGPHINLVSEEKKLKLSLPGLIRKQNIDIFIIGFQSNGNNAADILSFITKTLPLFFPESKVIIMAEIKGLGKLKDYLLGINNVCAVLDNAISLHEMRLRLTEILILPKNVGPNHIKSSVISLTNQELKVLDFLLKGKSASEVANKLCIHYKTVSSHKQSALHKLGIHSLHGLLTSGTNPEMMYKLLRYFSSPEKLCSGSVM